ncbi:MAG: Ppx/GppA family phosphatase, partial [Phenylobacterium sp.]|nr:Ppx/GppA family phosphatase [Phenylobacterium sp.]
MSEALSAPGASKNGRERSGSDAPCYGALDLGTNNCRLLIATPSGKSFRVVEAYSRIVRLGEGLSASGRLSEAAMERAMAALKISAEKVRRRRVVKLKAIATQACRMA